MIHFQINEYEYNVYLQMYEYTFGYECKSLFLFHLLKRGFQYMIYLKNFQFWKWFFFKINYYTKFNMSPFLNFILKIKYLRWFIESTSGYVLKYRSLF